MIKELLTKSTAYLIKTVCNNNVALVVLLSLVFSNSSSAQIAQVKNNYIFSQSTGNAYIPITGGLTVVAAGTTFPAVSPSIPFNFRFNNFDYTYLFVSSNGFISLGGTAPSGTNYSPISGTEGAGIISAYGYRLYQNNITVVSSTAEVSYVITGISPNRIFTAQYKDCFRRKLSTITGLINMQINLYESDGKIEINYGTPSYLSSGSNGLITDVGQVGLRGSGPSDYLNRGYTTGGTNWANPDNKISNGTSVTSALPLTTASGYDSGLRYLYTPCYRPNSIVGSLQPDLSTLDVSWTAPFSPAATYIYEVRADALPGGSASPTYTGTVTSPSNSFQVTGLLLGQPYTIWVRPDCNASGWSQGPTFTPTCPAQVLPYTETFENVTAGFATFASPTRIVSPKIPLCTDTFVVSGNAFVTNDNTATAYFGFNNKNLRIDNINAQDTWFFTQKITLAAGSYKLSYKYGGSREVAAYNQKMRIAVGPNKTATGAGMTGGTFIADHDAIKTSPINGVVNFTITSPGDYYIGFEGYALANNGYLLLDDIDVRPSTCLAPTGLVTSQLAGNSTYVNWTPPATPPSTGYEYYFPTAPIAATPPIATTVPTGTLGAGVTNLFLNNLLSGTTYYIWVRGNCGGETSAWTMVTFTTVGYCIPSSGVATTYASNVTTTAGITNISRASASSALSGYGNYTGIQASQFIGTAINFSVTVAGGPAGVAVFIDYNNNGSFLDALETVYTSGALVNSATGSFIPPAGTAGNHRMRVMVDKNATNPSPCGFFATPSTQGEIQDYTFKCVIAPPTLTLSSSASTQCASSNSPTITVSVTGGSYDTFTWSPATGVTGTYPNYVFNSPITNTFTLTAAQNTTPYNTSTKTFIYTANPLPSPITLSPAIATICPGTPVMITASGGVTTPAPVTPVSDNFNGAGTYTTINNSFPVNATVNVPAFTLRTTGYNPGGSAGTGAINSNDNSQYYISNSDGQGSGNTTDVTLLSPTFTLTGATAASLSFYHFYKPWINGSAKVEIYNSATATWVQLDFWGDSSTTVAQGSSTVFKNQNYDLAGYIGMSNLQLRFKYTAIWGYVWAIDTVLVTASSSSSTTWSPITGLYLDAAGTTTPITALTTTNVVYANPAATQTYTATATTTLGCIRASTPVTVTVTNIAGGIVAPATQTICSSAATLTLGSYTGTIVKWQSASDVAFTAAITDIAVTTATLTSVQMGSLSANKYFRAVISVGGSCIKNSSVASVLVNSTTWNGSTWIGGVPDATKRVIFNANYTSTGDITACTAEVALGIVVFNAGHKLILTNELKVSNSGLPFPTEITFKSGSTLYQTNPLAVNTGFVTYERASTGMRKYDYTYWSSPVVNQNLNAFSPDTMADKFLSWNAGAATWTYLNSLTTTMVTGVGYAIRAPDVAPFNTTTTTIFTGKFIGIPNNGTYSTTVSLGGLNANLIGNPYPSALNADEFLNETNNNGFINGTIYLWTHNTPITNGSYTNADYAVYNLFGAIGTVQSPQGGINTSVPTKYIPAGQAFFVEAIDNGTVLFNNALRVNPTTDPSYNNNSFFRSATATSTSSISDIERNRIWLEITNTEGAYKQALIGYAQNATDGLDRNFDGKLFDVNNVAAIYSLLGTTKLSIQGKALPFNVNDVIPLGYRSNVATAYTIKLSDFDGLFATQAIYLEDKVANVIHNLKDSDYSFTTNAGTFNERFEIRYTTTALSVAANLFTDESVIVIKNNSNQIQVVSSGTPLLKIAVFDIQGREIYSKDGINANAFTISNLNTAKQVVVIKITSVEGTIVNKKILF